MKRLWTALLVALVAATAVAELAAQHSNTTRLVLSPNTAVISLDGANKDRKEKTRLRKAFKSQWEVVSVKQATKPRNGEVLFKPGHTLKFVGMGLMDPLS